MLKGAIDLSNAAVIQKTGTNGDKISINLGSGVQDEIKVGCDPRIPRIIR